MLNTCLIKAETNLRPQDRFKNPKGYSLAIENDVFYCKFDVDAPKAPGVYHFIIDGTVVYTGRAKCLKNRLSVQYGTVSPRHPFEGGQIQKCRMNAKINTALWRGSSVSVKWEIRDDYEEFERELLRNPEQRPIWNKRG